MKDYAAIPRDLTDEELLRIENERLRRELDRMRRVPLYFPPNYPWPTYPWNPWASPSIWC